MNIRPSDTDIGKLIKTKDQNEIIQSLIVTYNIKDNLDINLLFLQSSINTDACQSDIASFDNNSLRSFDPLYPEA